MIPSKVLRALLLLLSFQVIGFEMLACSMYKITKAGKTMVGSNYDSYFLTPRIWFEVAAKPTEYGAAFSGARLDGKNGFAPQSGLNEAGLAFSRAAVAMRDFAVRPGRKQITNPTQFMKRILHTCKNVAEVKAYFSKYDHSFFNGDVFLYTDKVGNYLVVEPDTMHFGTEAKYVLSNFCPSITNPSAALQMAKYRKGLEFRKNQIDSSLAFCTGLSDTMHVCREKVGDGTLLTNINDLTNGILYYYFYHNYKHPVKFNLQAELAKGNHMYKVPELFPENAEFEKLTSYKTPQNNNSIMLFLFSCAGLFLFSAFYFLISFFRKRTATRYAYLKLILFAIGLLLGFYMLVLLRTENIFYFSAPYKDPGFGGLNFSAYLPVALLLIIIPLLLMNRKILVEAAWGRISKWLFTLNSIAFLGLLILFGYWGLFSVFS